MKTFLLKRADGVEVMQLVSGTVEEALAKWTPDHRASILSWREIDRSEIPPDRTFRSAWVDNGKIDHDMAKCRDIQREKMRKARAPLLTALDVEYQRADEAGDNAKKRDIAARKQALRDVTDIPEIEAAKTPEELKAVWPDILK